MPRPRKSLVSLSDTPYYHCISRCVRRAFLCGRDKFSGRSYEHRRHWVEDRLLFLGSVFGINICAYAVMSNHTHVVLHVDKDRVQQWTTDEVLQRWHQLHKGTILTNRYLNTAERATMSSAEITSVESAAAIYRQRLYDISWFMRLLNEPIARRANKEDNCTGRFWEGRFKSQALLGETALAACMAYVDLNPMRAGLAKSPKQSSYTSIKKRIKAAENQKQPRRLSPFIGQSSKRLSSGLPFLLKDYIQIVELTSRQYYATKGSRLPASISMLENSTLAIEEWYWLVANIEKKFSTHISLGVAQKKLKQQKVTIA